MSQSRIALVALVMILATCRSFGDVAGEYESYIRQAIPLSHEIADKHAYLSEHAVFVDNASMLQSALGSATKKYSYVGYYASQLSEGPSAFCPNRPDGSIDIPGTLRALFSVSQIIHFVSEIKRDLLAFEQMAAGFIGACETDSHFENYRMASTHIQYYSPPELSIFDGVMVTAAFGGGSSGGAAAAGATEEVATAVGMSAETVVLVATVAVSLVQAGINYFQKKKLKELYEEFVAKRANDNDYRQYAKKHCAEILLRNGGVRKLYDPVVNELKARVEQIPLDKLGNARKIALQCLDRFDAEFVAYSKDRARQATASAMRGILSPEALKATIEIKQNVFLNLARLRKATSVELGRPLIETIRNDLALLMLYPQSEPTNKFVTDVRATLRAQLQRLRGVAP